MTIDFSFATWPANTDITLCNVPWDNQYRDVVRFTNRAALDAYINADSTRVNVEDMTYARVNEPVRVNLPFNTVNAYNYIRVINGASPVDVGNAFYYFITSVTYIAPNTTEITVQLDVFQSYGRSMEITQAYLEQGHMGCSNSNRLRNNGVDFLSVPEGLQIDDLTVVDVYSQELMNAIGDDMSTADYAILVTSTVELDGDYGTVSEPLLKTADGSAMENLPNGATHYVIDNVLRFNSFMSNLSLYPWISQCIVSITAIPHPNRYEMDTIINDTNSKRVLAGSLKRLKTRILPSTWKTRVNTYYGQQMDMSAYTQFDKFMVYPYTALEMTAHSGSPVVLQPELWPSGEVVEVPHFASASPRIVFYPFEYNKLYSGNSIGTVTDSFGVRYDAGEYTDVSTGIYNFPSFSIVNDSYINFLASNANSLTYQRETADWSQSKVNASLMNANVQTDIGMRLSDQLNKNTIDANNQSTQLANNMGLARGAMGVAGSALSRDPMGMVTNAINTGMDMHQRTQQNAINNSASRTSTRMSNSAASQVRDVNQMVGQYAAQGDYANAIAGINAKTSDAKLIAPSVSGQNGGDAFNLATRGWVLDLKVKSVRTSTRQIIGDYWLRYGYRVDRFVKVPANLKAMSHFTYWRLKETYIRGNMPEEFKQVLRGIFERGTTVWHDVEYLENPDFRDNRIIGGVTIE